MSPRDEVASTTTVAVNAIITSTLAALTVTFTDLPSIKVPVGVARDLPDHVKVINTGTAPVKVTNVCVASGAIDTRDTNGPFAITSVKLRLPVATCLRAPSCNAPRSKATG